FIPFRLSSDSFFFFFQAEDGIRDFHVTGVQTCALPISLRARSAQLPIIFLTARESELDAVSGLRLGADDYLTKRVSIEHLLARVAALFRRIEALQSGDEEAERLVRGSLSLDRDRMTAHWKDRQVPLTLTEFWVVHALAAHPGHVKNREQLMRAANVVLDDSTVTSQIKRIRAKF